MATDISDAFIRQYERDVHLTYQRMGSTMRSTVRVKTDIEGESTTFQKIGKGTATTKARHAAVPTMNIDHTAPVCPLVDYYAGDFVDRLDENKIGHDERTALLMTGAGALGRKTDEIITTAMDGEADSGGGAAAWTVARARAMVTDLFKNDVPANPESVYVALGFDQWDVMMADTTFSSVDFVGDHPLTKYTTPVRWRGATWFPFNGLPLSSTTRSVFAYDMRSVGFASGQDITAEITYHGDRVAHFVNNFMSQGAVVIDSTGIIKYLASE
jgi:hypothetical protein